MKKVKQSKKRWAWTEAQKRKKWSLLRGRMGPPSWYCKFYHIENKTGEKQFIHKIKNGFDADYLEMKIKNQSSSAGYSWW